MSTFSSYGLLSQEKIHIAEKLSSLRASLGYGAANAIYEMMLGAGPPGGQGLLFMPHDHCEIGTSLARSSQYSFARKQDSASWLITCVVLGTYYHLDRNGLTQHKNITNKPVGVPDLVLYVTPGIDSDNTNVSSNDCALEAKIVMYADSGTTDVRVFNRTTNSASTASQTATSGSVVRLATITDIPCKGGKWNEIDIEIKNDTNGAIVNILDINIAETRSASQPVSGGSATLTAASKP